MNRIVIGLGSNIDAESNIEKARTILKTEHSFLKESRFITTSPVGFTDQPDFVNGAFLIESDLDFDQMKVYLREVESRLHRVRSENKYGPRTIDLDIVVWNGRIVDDDYYTRDFLKNAVHEILPDLTENGL